MSNATRRSSRARTSQPPLNGGSGPSGSNSSASSLKDEKLPRSMTRQESQLKSATPRSASPAESTARDTQERDTRRTRQHKKEDEDEAATSNAIVDDDDDEEEGDDEVTRCICRKLEYPGPPVPVEPVQRSNRPRDSQTSGDGPQETPGDLFIQCDTCQVWQHGGCVGIMTNDAAPNNYYCEKCRPHEHELMTGSRGQRYSRYLPVVGSAMQAPGSKARRPSDVKKEKDKDKDTEGRTGKDSESKNLNIASGKRRSTMNSRVAWEEEQNLLRALEASRGGDNGKARNKRSHEDGEESSHEPKRRKTESSSATPPAEPVNDAESDEDEANGPGRKNSTSKKARSAAAQVQRENEIRKRAQEREREKAEAASKRKERAGRRRADDSPPPPPPSQETTKPATTKNSKARPQNTSSKGGTSMTPPTSSAGKKSSRMTTRKGRSGRNGRDGDKAESPNGSEEMENGTDIGISGNGLKPARPRPMNAKKTTINELRRRAAAISEFITRTQVEMAGTTSPPNEKVSPPAPTRAGVGRAGTGASVNGASKLSHEIRGDEETDETARQGGGEEADSESRKGEAEEEEEGGAVDEEVFRKMSTIQMMEVLSHKIVGFQKEHGKFGER